jgi:hypothetical protein
MTAAQTLRAAIGRIGSAQRTKLITDPFAQAVARKLESHRITRVPGLPVDEPEWFDLAIESHRRNEGIRVAREAKQKAEKAAQEPRSTASILMGEIARAATGSASQPIPLNGAAVLRAALNGGGGTINGGPSD